MHLKILKKNLKNLSILNKAKILINNKIENFIKKKKIKKKYNIFFFDPPF